MVKKLWKKIKNTIITHKIHHIKPKDYQLNKTGNKIWNHIYNAEKHRYSLNIMKPFHTDWEKLYNFSILKQLYILIPTITCANKAHIRNKLPKQLHTIIGMKEYKNLYWEWKEKPFLKQKWTKKTYLPIIIQYKDKNVVIDGNHRLAQQIHQNKIRYLYVEGDISWKRCFQILKNS